VSGKADDYIRIYYCAQYGYLSQGKPVHPAYVDKTHCYTEPIKPVQGLPIIVGIDFGLTPAAAFVQHLPSGRWHVIDELVTEDMGASQFADMLKPMITHKYRGYDFEFYGDPAGNQESQTDKQTPFQILNAKGIPAVPAYRNNDAEIRRSALDEPLRRMIDGAPGLYVSPDVTMIREGLMGGYCYKLLKTTGDETRYKEVPDKNRYSHIIEALEYALLGAGEGIQLVQTSQKQDFGNLITHIPQIDSGDWMAA
jgi:hypothetical protein